MKRKLVAYCLGLLAMLYLLGACSASKEARSMKKTINGDWTLQTINTEGIDARLKAKIFNEADLNCFVGSNWNFVSNSSSGSYTLAPNTAGCTPVNRQITWTIYEPKDAEKEFQFKRMESKNKPMDDNAGFRLNVTALTDHTMQLKSAITFENKPGYIVYNFIKK